MYNEFEKERMKCKKLARKLKTYSDCVDNIRILDCVRHRIIRKNNLEFILFKNTNKINWVERFKKSIIPKSLYKIKNDTVRFILGGKRSNCYYILLHYIRIRLSSVKPKDAKNYTVMDVTGNLKRTTLYDFTEQNKLKLIVNYYYKDKINVGTYYLQQSNKCTYNYKTRKFKSNIYVYNKFRSDVLSDVTLSGDDKVVKKFISMVLEKANKDLKYKSYYDVESIYNIGGFNMKYFNLILKYPYISLSHCLNEFYIKKYLDNIKSDKFKNKYESVFKKILKLDKTDPNYYQKFFEITSVPTSLRSLVCKYIDIYFTYIVLREFFSVDISILKAKTISKCYNPFHLAGFNDDYNESLMFYNKFDILNELVKFKFKESIVFGYIDSGSSYYGDVIRLAKAIICHIPDYNFKKFKTVLEAYGILMKVMTRFKDKNFKFKYDDKVKDVIIDGYEMGRVKESQDLINISEQLNNCVSSYVSTVTNRDEDIYYIKKDNKYVACISVRCLNKEIKQFKFNCNDTIDKHMEYKEIVKKFIKNYNLINKTEDLKGI